mmetsp:Transcript_115921/g.231091  ORF Transcript_115921/g.231091 Transcript_115921/m.231091 type:complete len:225 (+) Transcript_115921:382-1056(+)
MPTVVTATASAVPLVTPAAFAISARALSQPNATLPPASSAAGACLVFGSGGKVRFRLSNASMKFAANTSCSSTASNPGTATGARLGRGKAWMACAASSSSRNGVSASRGTWCSNRWMSSAAYRSTSGGVDFTNGGSMVGAAVLKTEAILMKAARTEPCRLPGSHGMPRPSNIMRRKTSNSVLPASARTIAARRSASSRICLAFLTTKSFFVWPEMAVSASSRAL